MGIFDKLKGVLNPEDEYEEYEEYEEEEEERPRSSSSRQSFSGFSATTSVSRDDLASKAASKLQVILFKPTGFEDVKPVADNLNKKHTVVLNLEAASRETCQRVLDFLGGVAYANSGRISKVAVNTYIITPANVDMQGEEVGEFDVNSLF